MSYLLSKGAGLTPMTLAQGLAMRSCMNTTHNMVAITS